MNFFPDDSPSWDYLWEHRPRIRKPRLPSRETWPADIAWSLPGIATLALWTRYTGMGISLNTALGGLFFPTKSVSVVGMSGRPHWHTSGASPSFTTGVAQTLAANAVPLALATIAVASAAGYVSTADEHGGATGMLSGDVNMGIPVGHYSDSSNPMGDFRSGVEGLAFWR